MGGTWAIFVLFVCFLFVCLFLVIFWRVAMIGVPCTGFFVFTEVLGYTRLKLGVWVELGPTNIYEFISCEFL